MQPPFSKALLLLRLGWATSPGGRQDSARPRREAARQAVRRAGRLAPGRGWTRLRALRTRRCAPARPGPRASELGARALPRSSAPLDPRAPDAVLRRAQPRRRGPPELTLPLRAPPPPRRNPARPPACLRASPRPLPPVPATARPWARRGRLRVRAAAVASSASEACDAAEPGSPSVHLREPRRRPQRRRRDER